MLGTFTNIMVMGWKAISLGTHSNSTGRSLFHQLLLFHQWFVPREATFKDGPSRKLLSPDHRSAGAGLGRGALLTHERLSRGGGMPLVDGDLKA